MQTKQVRKDYESPELRKVGKRKLEELVQTKQVRKDYESSGLRKVVKRKLEELVHTMQVRKDYESSDQGLKVRKDYKSSGQGHEVRKYYESSELRQVGKSKLEELVHTKQVRKVYESSEQGPKVRKDYESSELRKVGKRKLEELAHAKQVRKDYESSEHGRKVRQNYEHKRLLDSYEVDTGFNIICCSCNEYKSRQACVNTIKRGSNESRFTDEEEAQFLLRDNDYNLSLDGNFYICISCKNQIESKKSPRGMTERFYNIMIFQKNCWQR